MANPAKPKQPKEKPTHSKGNQGRGGAQPGAGRPGFVPTDDERRQVEALSGYGLPFDHIAALVRGGIHIDTLRKHFADELVIGKAKANGSIGKTLFQKAMSGDTAAMIWWTKAQMRWSETSNVNSNVSGNLDTRVTFTVQPVKPINEA